ncbi:MAG: nodulation protein NfeD [bacterium]|nr:nodulation protein NfeD [bacterium]
MGKRLAIFTVILLTTLLQAKEDRVINVIKVEGVITPITVSFVDSAITQSEEENAELLIIQLDTPGGLEQSMRSIVKRFFQSKIPIVVYVSPEGGRAASAGVFITMAADFAVMAPTTNIGAAHPVAMGMRMDEHAEKKVVNDTVAFIKEICKKRGRNMRWAERCVRESVSIGADEAQKLHVIDFIASDLQDLLEKLDGRKVKDKILHTKDKELRFIKMNVRRQFLQTISDPNIAYILLILGIYGLIYEFMNPGIGFAGVFGGISLILAFFSFQSLPINIAGLLLILLGIILLILDFKIPSHGILTLGGIVSFTLGSFMLIDVKTQIFSISAKLIISVSIITVLFSAFAISLALKAQRREVATGIRGMIGQIGYAKEDFEKKGIIYCQGEYWNAINLGEVIKKDDRVKILEYKGNKVYVEKVKE